MIEAFGTDDKAVIAEKLGFSSVQAVYKVINGERELDFEKLQNFRKYTKRSIDWLLTGIEETPAELPQPVHEDIFTSRIREIVRDEIREAMAAVPVQELGAVDDFDIEAAVRKYDNALFVLRDWYAHENVAVQLPQTLDFKGWEKLTLEQKVHEVIGAKETIDQARDFEQRYEASTKLKHP